MIAYVIAIGSSNGQDRFKQEFQVYILSIVFVLSLLMLPLVLMLMMLVLVLMVSPS
jgi:hypothetical protein